MIKALRLDTQRVQADYLDAMTVCIDRLLDEYYSEVAAGMHTEGAKNDLDRVELDSTERGLLTRRLVGGVLAVLDSYGTGTRMDVDNPALDAYIAGGLYNPARPKVPGAHITGRPEGDYTNIFGQQKHSTGRMAGVPLEGAEGLGAREPSFAFQNADKWFWETDRVWKMIEEYTREFFAGLRANAGRYWRFG